MYSTILHPTQTLIYDHLKGIRRASLKEVVYQIEQLQQIKDDALACSIECDILTEQLNKIKQNLLVN